MRGTEAVGGTPTQPSMRPLLPTTCDEARVGEERARQA